MLDLIVEELAEILHVHLGLLRVDHRGKAVELDPLIVQPFHSHDDVAELAYAGRLDENAVRREFADDLLQSPSKIADQRTADAAGVHLVDLHSRVLQESAVDADLPKFIFYQYDLFAFVGFLNEFFDQSGLSCP